MGRFSAFVTFAGRKRLIKTKGVEICSAVPEEEVIKLRPLKLLLLCPPARVFVMTMYHQNA